MELHNCTNTSSINMSTEDYLQSLQDEANKMMAPAVTFLIILALVGLIGNSLVLVVYWKKFHLNPTKVLIMTIAGVDLVANTGTIPMELSAMFHYWTFRQAAWCRGSMFLNVFTTVSGAVALLAVAVVRYRKVCVPFGWQVTLTQAKLVSAAAILLGVVLSIPYIMLYGRMSKPTPCYKIQGYECYIENTYKDTIWPLLTGGFFLLLYFSVVIPLIILYILIGLKATRRRDVQKIYSQRSAQKKQHSSSQKPPCSFSTEQVSPASHKLVMKGPSLKGSVDRMEAPDSVSDDDFQSCTENDKQSSFLVNTSSSSSRNEITGDASENVSSEVEMRATSKTETRKVLMTCLKINAPYFIESTNPVGFDSNEDTNVMLNEKDLHNRFDNSGKETLNRDSSKPDRSAMFEHQNCFYPVAKEERQNKGKSIKKKNLKHDKISETKRSSAKRAKSNKTNTKRRGLGHMTAMLITISATYALGYLSFLILSIFRDAFPQKFADLSMTDLSFHHLFLRLYFLNSAANPVIYSLCDQKFRRECLNLFRRKPQRNL